MRGSHRRPELDGKRARDFDIAAYDEDLVQFDCPAGSIIAFHQAQWHAAPANLSQRQRKNCYISYCPTWMRPLDYEPSPPGQSPNGLDGLSAQEAFLLSAHRPPMRYWVASEEDKQVLSRFGRDVS